MGRDRGRPSTQRRASERQDAAVLLRLLRRLPDPRLAVRAEAALLGFQAQGEREGVLPGVRGAAALSRDPGAAGGLPAVAAAGRPRASAVAGSAPDDDAATADADANESTAAAAAAAAAAITSCAK